MNTLNRDGLGQLFPDQPGPPPPEQQVQEQVEPLRQVVEDHYGCALLPRPFVDARPVRIGEFFGGHPAPVVSVTRDGVTRDYPLVDVPAADLWGVELQHEEGGPSLAAYYWGNDVGFRFFAYRDHATALELARQYLELQEARR